ncbi:hypothetical protein Trydic_g4875 [Trypoxylus dichotomus]
MKLVKNIIERKTTNKIGLAEKNAWQKVLTSFNAKSCQPPTLTIVISKILLRRIICSKQKISETDEAEHTENVSIVMETGNTRYRLNHIATLLYPISDSFKEKEGNTNEDVSRNDTLSQQLTNSSNWSKYIPNKLKQKKKHPKLRVANQPTSIRET